MLCALTVFIFLAGRRDLDYEKSEYLGVHCVLRPFRFRCVWIGSNLIPVCSLSVTKLIEMAQTDHACSVNLVYMTQKLMPEMIQCQTVIESKMAYHDMKTSISS